MNRLVLCVALLAIACGVPKPPELPLVVGPATASLEAEKARHAVWLKPLTRGHGDFGTAHPFLVRTLGHDWLVACQIRNDTNGDGRIHVDAGYHGELYGDTPRLYLFWGGGEGQEIDASLAVDDTKRFLVYREAGQMLVLDTSNGDRMNLSPFGDIEPQHLVMVPGYRIALVQKVGTWSRILLLSLLDGSGDVLYQTRSPIWGLSLSDTNEALLVHEIPEDTNGDGKIRLPTVYTSWIGGICSGPKWPLMLTSFLTTLGPSLEGDKPSERSITLPKGSDEETRGTIKSVYGCTADGEQIRARYVGPCGSDATCDDVLLLTAGQGDDRTSAIGVGPARWAPSDSVRLEPCDGGWSATLSRLKVAERHPRADPQQSEGTVKAVTVPYTVPLRSNGIDFGQLRIGKKDCQDSREKLLIAQSETPVTFATEKRCKVATGRWRCDYSGAMVTDRQALVVEPLVSIEEALATGDGWEDDWTRRKFSNGKTNLSIAKKSAAVERRARTVEEWLPLNQELACKFVRNWTLVKSLNNLSVTEVEAAILAAELQRCDLLNISPSFDEKPMR